jgi:hypothetical protein
MARLGRAQHFRPLIQAKKIANTQLAADQLASARITAALTSGIALAVTMACGASMSAGLTAKVSMSVDMAAVAQFTPAFPIPWAVDMLGRASVTAPLSTSFNLATDLTAVACCVADLTNDIEMQVSQTAQPGMVAALSANALFVASMRGSSRQVAALINGIPLAASSILARSSLATNLGTAIPLSIGLTGRLVATAGLTTISGADYRPGLRTFSVPVDSHTFAVPVDGHVFMVPLGPHTFTVPVEEDEVTI